MKKHSETEVCRQLAKKNDCKVHQSHRTVEILSDTVHDKEQNTIPNPKKKHDLGNKSWGRIDFLVNYCGYRTRYVSEF